MKKVKSTTAKKMYHLSPIRNKQSILDNGLQSENGEIFFFTKLEQAKHIACNQVGTEKYSIFEIDLAGIKGKLLKDNVAEFGSAFQFYVEQKSIEPQFVKHFLDVESNLYDQAEECELPKYRVLAKLYGARGKKQIDEVALAMLEELVSFNRQWIEHYNKKYNKSIKFVDLNSLKAA
jgi:hypothetical protein